jgi:hypothetical protein
MKTQPGQMPLFQKLPACFLHHLLVLAPYFPFCATYIAVEGFYLFATHFY